MNSTQNQNLIYLYDLPKQFLTSKKLAEVFVKQAGIHLKLQPQIKRDITRPFYTAIVSITDDLQYEKACEAMRYFEVDGKPCRGLQFDKALLGNNREKLITHNVFIRTIPKDMKHKEIEEKFEAVGKIKSLKISLNSDHTSRGYGFICFQEEEDAQKAVEFTAKDESIVAMKFQPKDARDLINLINNVYVKNIPLDWTDDQVKTLFEEFGTIKSLVLRKNDIGQFGFVCFDDPNQNDIRYGPRCAASAIESLNNKQITEDHKLYVRYAMKRADREVEKKRDAFKYKVSKKRCNLFVKNFPIAWNEGQIRQLFQEFGEIENVRFEKGQQGNVFAFVCYKSPDSAANAKQSLHGTMYDNKPLLINFYEIKEIRQIQIEEAIDKSDFEKYQAINRTGSGSFRIDDLSTHPHMTHILQQLLEIMHQNDMIGPNYNQNDNRNYQRNYRRYNQNNRQNYGNNNSYGNMNQNSGGYSQQQNSNNYPQQPGMDRMPRARGFPHSNQTPGMAPAMPSITPGGQMQQTPAQMTPATRYLAITQRLLPSVTEKNPYLKEQTGQAIFEFVTMFVGKERAPKITGMLIELPVDQIKQYMNSLDALQSKVNEASELIDQAEKVAKEAKKQENTQQKS